MMKKNMEYFTKNPNTTDDMLINRDYAPHMQAYDKGVHFVGEVGMYYSLCIAHCMIYI